MRVLVTGGAGFVGSSLALRLQCELNDAKVLAVDNLKRRGSELALRRLQAGGVDFVHGDIRNPEDLESVGPFDLMIECSAEPSVHAGYDGSPGYVLNTNLVGTINCLEAARRAGASLIFLSTSRVYPIRHLRGLPLEVANEGFEIPASASGTGWSSEGITTDFPMSGSRSLYGATKLASELVIEEYAEMYGLEAVINRCGVIAGPWQMGKVDQGFFVLWAARHLYGGTLSYRGFGGHGHQVRDVLHIADLCDLVFAQIQELPKYAGTVYNVGGGRQRSVSLAQLTRLCADVGRDPSLPPLELGNDPATSSADIPYYITDNTAVSADTDWAPQRTTEGLLEDIVQWLSDERAILEPILGSESP